MKANKLHPCVSYDIIEFFADGNHMCIHSDDGEDLFETIIDSLDEEDRVQEDFNDRFSYTHGHYTTPYRYEVEYDNITEHPDLILNWINKNVSRWRDINQED